MKTYWATAMPHRNEDTNVIYAVSFYTDECLVLFLALVFA